MTSLVITRYENLKPVSNEVFFTKETFTNSLRALKKARDEMNCFKDDAQCDHGVNICYCSFWDTLAAIENAIEELERQ